MNNLALAYRRNGKNQKAIEIFEATAELSKVKRGIDNPSTLTVMYNLGESYLLEHRFTDAISIWQDVLVGIERQLGPEHPNTQSCMKSLASAYVENDQLKEARVLFSRIVELKKSKSGLRDSLARVALHEYAYCSLKLGELSAAKDAMTELVLALKGNPETTPASLAYELAFFGKVLIADKRFLEAEKAMREAVSHASEDSSQPWKVLDYKLRLAESLAGQSKDSDAEAIYLESGNGLIALFATMPEKCRNSLLEACSSISRFYSERGFGDKAAKWDNIRMEHDLAKSEKKE